MYEQKFVYRVEIQGQVGQQFDLSLVVCAGIDEESEGCEGQRRRGEAKGRGAKIEERRPKREREDTGGETREDSRGNIAEGREGC